MATLENSKQEELGVATVPASVTHIKYYFDQVFVSLTNGMIAIFRRLNGKLNSLQKLRCIIPPPLSTYRL